MDDASRTLSFWRNPDGNRNVAYLNRWNAGKTPIHLDDRLKESNYGRLEALTWPEIERYHGVDLSKWKREKRLPNFDYAPYGGERMPDVGKRHLESFKELCAYYTRDTILLVGHGGGLAALLHTLGRDQRIE